MKTTVFENGTIRVGGRHPDQSRLVIRDGVVLPCDAPVPSDAERIDLDGGLLLPAFADGHAHPLLAGRETYGPVLRDARTVDEIIDRVRRWAAEDESPWLVGGSYDATIAPDGLFDATWLDRAESTRPVVLHSWDYHTAWANTAALSAAGIEHLLDDPENGRIVRRADGTAMGTLVERPAIDLVLDLAPPPAARCDIQLAPRDSPPTASPGCRRPGRSSRTWTPGSPRPRAVASGPTSTSPSVRTPTSGQGSSIG